MWVGCGLLAAAGCARAPAPQVPPAEKPPPPGPPVKVDWPSSGGDRRVEQLIEQMTLDEKLAQLITGRAGDDSPEEVCRRFPHGIGGVGRLGLHRGPQETAEFVNAMQRCFKEGTRLGIPPFVIDEALHGYMAQGATSFPQAIALGATWDPALVAEVFTVAAREARARGTTWVLTPVLDLARDPRWGRTDETYGEDPWLASRLGVAAILGLQGSGPIGSDRVLATAKHFAVHGQPESGSNGGPGSFGERTLREELLPPFEAAVREASVRSVMASYTDIDGVPAHVNRWLLNGVLREEWGFSGFVTSDGKAIPELVRLHHIADRPEQAAIRAMQSGIDFELGDTFGGLQDEVQAGRLALEVVDRAVTRVLRTKLELGLLDDPSVDPEAAEQVTNTAEHRALALRAAEEALVLLKNDQGLLPFDRTKLRSMAVIGPNAARTHLGSYSVDPLHTVSVLEGIRAKVGDSVTVRYAEGCRITEEDLTWKGWWQDKVELPDPQEDSARIAEAIRVARASDLVLLVLGENEATSREGWSQDHLGDRDSLQLLGRQNELLRAIVRLKKPVVVLLINGRPLAAGEVLEQSQAVLEGFYLGQETGTAVANVLFGDRSPSGKLPVTLPRSVGQLPVYYYRKPSARRGYLFTSNEPLRPFGYGLSYTRFEYSRPTVTPTRIGVNGSARVSVTLSNRGSREGTEVVQLYVHDRTGSVTRPVKLLRDFARVKLAPGESREVQFELGRDDLSLFDERMQRVVEPGWFDLHVGGNSVDGVTAELEVVASK